MNEGKGTVRKDQTTANRKTVFCFVFHEVGTAVWPRKFSGKKISVAILPFLLREKKTPSFDSPWFGLSYRAFAIVYSSLVALLRLIHRDSRNLRELTLRGSEFFRLRRNKVRCFKTVVRQAVSGTRPRRALSPILKKYVRQRNVSRVYTYTRVTFRGRN